MPINFGSSGIGEIYYGSTPIKEVYAGSQLVWSAFKPSYGLVFGRQGSTYSWRPTPYNTWVKGVEGSVDSGASPHPDYPDTVVVNNGVNVIAGTYLVNVWSISPGSGSGNRGIRAIIDGVPITGLQYLENLSGYDTPMAVSSVVTLGSGNVTLEGYASSSSTYLGVGGNARTGITLVHV